MTAQTFVPSDRHELILIVTDSRPLAMGLQQALARLSQNSPSVKVVSIDEGIHAVQSHRDIILRVLVALGSDLDRGLDAIRMIGEICPVPLIVIGPRDAGLILDAIHAGADDFVEDADPLDENLAKALFRQNTFGKTTSGIGQLICVASARP